jgi:hypothetical protein
MRGLQNMGREPAEQNGAALRRILGSYFMSVSSDKFSFHALELMCGTAAIFGKTGKGGGQGSDDYVYWLVNMSPV